MERKTIKLTLLAAMISSSLSLQAQTQNDKQVERIQVTGSHIKRTDMEGPSPITSLSADDISKTGVTC
jgi:iron complex outermembrane receptor protein